MSLFALFLAMRGVICSSSHKHILAYINRFIGSACSHVSVPSVSLATPL